MRLLVAIISKPGQVPDILDEFLEIGVHATVIDSTGMVRLLAPHVPFFSRFAEFGRDVAHNKTIFTVIPTDELVNKAVDSIERIVGNLDEPDTGLVFTLPVDFCKGISEFAENDE